MDRIDILSLPDWDAADYLATAEDQADYLSLAMEDGDEAEIAHALAAIERAQARGKEGGVASTRISAPTSTLDDANALSKAHALIKALGLKVHLRPADAA